MTDYAIFLSHKHTIRIVDRYTGKNKGAGKLPNPNHIAFV